MQTNTRRLNNIQQELAVFVRCPHAEIEEGFKSDIRDLLPFFADEMILTAIKEKGGQFKEYLLSLRA
jgi:hypothetical protein